MREPIIFLSYSHRDERKKDQLVTQLGVKYAADLWDDDRIRPGEDWKGEIDRAMARSKVAVLLVTANFLTSNFILDVEVPELLERHRRGGLSVFPVIASECAWQLVPWLSGMNVRPKNGRPVWDGGRYVNRKLAEIVREIDGILGDDPAPAKSRTVLSSVRGEQRTSVAEALEEVDAALEKFRDPLRMNDLEATEKVLVLAISYGAPIYNRGDIFGCAEIYLHTAAGLTGMTVGAQSTPRGAMALPERPPFRGPGGRPMPGWGGPMAPGAPAAPETKDAGAAVAREELGRAAALRLDELTADEVAWEIRHVFDHIRFIAQGRKTVSNAFGHLRESRTHCTVTLPEAIKVALAQGDLIYKEGLSRHKNWIRGCAAVYLHAAGELQALLKTGGTIKWGSLDGARRELERAVRDSRPLKEENAYRIAWDVRHALERIAEVAA